jgi:UDP-glucose 4-epimerase
VLVSDPALAQARLEWSRRYADIAVQMAHAWTWRQGGRGAFQRARAATSG